MANSYGKAFSKKKRSKRGIKEIKGKPKKRVKKSLVLDFNKKLKKSNNSFGSQIYTPLSVARGTGLLTLS
jgi:hypothetical protein